jgi:hypothetical protein
MASKAFPQQCGHVLREIDSPEVHYKWDHDPAIHFDWQEAFESHQYKCEAERAQAA